MLSNSQLVINCVENIFVNNVNRTVNFNIEVKNDICTLLIKIDNGQIVKKIDFNLIPGDLADLYLGIYKIFKDKYFNSQSRIISVFEHTDLSQIENYFLSLNIRDLHGNLVKINLDNQGYDTKESMEIIKKDWINFINKIKKI